MRRIGEASRRRRRTAQATEGALAAALDVVAARLRCTSIAARTAPSQGGG